MLSQRPVVCRSDEVVGSNFQCLYIVEIVARAVTAIGVTDGNEATKSKLHYGITKPRRRCADQHSVHGKYKEIYVYVHCSSVTWDIISTGTNWYYIALKNRRGPRVQIFDRDAE